MAKIFSCEICQLSLKNAVLVSQEQSTVYYEMSRFIARGD
jgi:hypothetical protein